MRETECVIVVSMIRNEEKLIESSIRYWLSFADRVIVYDHNSTDGTPEILSALREEYPDRVIAYVPDFDVGIEYVQKQLTEGMLREAFLRYHADLAFPLDADEYPFMAGRGSGTVRDYLRSLDQDHCYYTFWVPFACDDGKRTDGSQFAPLSYRSKRTDPITMFRKYLITGKQYRSEPICVSKGNHTIYRPSGNALPPEKDISPEMCYAHYMFRDPGHLKLKAASGWIANYSDIGWKGDSGHYQRIVRMILDGKVGPETVRWANITCCGLTEEKPEDVGVERINPRKLFDTIPVLRYTKRCSHGKDEFALLLETGLRLVEQYRDAKRALADREDGAEEAGKC